MQSMIIFNEVHKTAHNHHTSSVQHHFPVYFAQFDAWPAPQGIYLLETNPATCNGHGANAFSLGTPVFTPAGCAVIMSAGWGEALHWCWWVLPVVQPSMRAQLIDIMLQCLETIVFNCMLEIPPSLRHGGFIHIINHKSTSTSTHLIT